MSIKFEDFYKTCPYCKESDLQRDAIVCKHCKSDLTQSPSTNNTGCITTIAVILLIIGVIFSWILVIISILLFIWAAVLKKK